MQLWTHVDDETVRVSFYNFFSVFLCLVTCVQLVPQNPNKMWCSNVNYRIKHNCLQISRCKC